MGRSTRRCEAPGPSHVGGSLFRGRPDVTEKKRNLIKYTEIRFIGANGIEFADKFEQHGYALRLVLSIEQQAPELPPGLEGLETLQSGIELPATDAVQVEGADHSTNAAEKLHRFHNDRTARWVFLTGG
jgi:hypothetical protein